MKCWILLLNILIAVYHSYCAPNIFEQCLSESGIAKDKSVINMNDPNLKCFDTCIFKKQGLLKNGKIDVSLEFDMLKKGYRGSLSTLKDQVESCATTANQKSEECDIVNAMKKCISERIKA